MTWDQAVLPPYAEKQPPSPIRTQMGQTESELFISPDGNLLLNGQQVRHIETAGPLQVLCYTDRRDRSGNPTSIWMSDLLKTAYASGQAQPGQQDAWLTAYVRSRAALNEMLTLYTVTSVSSVLPALKGSDDFMESVDYARSALPRLPAEFENEEALFAAAVALNLLLRTLIEDFEQGDLDLQRIRGGRVFLEALQHIQSARAHLPLFHSTASTPSKRAATTVQTAASVIDKREEYAPLRDEVLKQIDWQHTLFTLMVTIGGIFLSLATQPGISGLVAWIVPVLGFGIAVKLAAHDLRSGQIGYYLRFALKSPWEVVRRQLFHGSTPTQQEQQILTEQGIDIQRNPDQKHELAPPFSKTHTLAHLVVFLTIYSAALGIGLIRTYQSILSRDPLTLFVLVLALLATAATICVLPRRRVR